MQTKSNFSQLQYKKNEYYAHTLQLSQVPLCNKGPDGYLLSRYRIRTTGSFIERKSSKVFRSIQKQNCSVLENYR